MKTRLPALAALAALLASSFAIAQPGTTVPQDPPSGPGLGQPYGAPVNGQPIPYGQAVPQMPPTIQLTPQEKDELKDVESEYEKFTKAAAEHDTRMRLIARRASHSSSTIPSGRST